MANFVMGWIAGFASLAAGVVVALAIVHIKNPQEETE